MRKIVAIYPFTQSIIGTEDAEYNFIITDIPENRVAAKSRRWRSNKL